MLIAPGFYKLSLIRSCYSDVSALRTLYTEVYILSLHNLKEMYVYALLWSEFIWIDKLNILTLTSSYWISVINILLEASEVLKTKTDL